MILIDYPENNSAASNFIPPNDDSLFLKTTTLFDLDAELLKTLQRSDIADSEKWLLYSRTLQRYLTFINQKRNAQRSAANNNTRNRLYEAADRSYVHRRYDDIEPNYYDTHHLSESDLNESMEFDHESEAINLNRKRTHNDIYPDVETDDLSLPKRYRTALRDVKRKINNRRYLLERREKIENENRLNKELST